MKTNVILLLLSILFFTSCHQLNEESDWRGPNRDGIYHETNLLKQWPENGPELLWSFEGLGYGHSSVAVANNKVYVTGVKDTVNSEGTLFVFDTKGNLLFEKEYGNDFTLTFQGPRSTPVIAGNYIYIESAVGTVYCLDAETCNKVWSKDFRKDFGLDTLVQFGNSESVLIDGDKLFCVPGAKENNVVALDRFTGEKIWSSPGVGEIATYNSPIVIDHNGKKMLIAQTSGSVMGFDAETGEMYWSVKHTQNNNIHANTPVYADGKLLVTSADRDSTSGMVLFQLSDNGREVHELWRNLKFRNFMGGVIKLDTCLYGSSYLRKNWEVIDWNTGETLAQNKDLGGGAIIYADGLFYCYAEREGEIALVKANPGSFEIISKFKVPLGTKEHWAHPVINNGILYIRHGDALMAYNIKQK